MKYIVRPVRGFAVKLVGWFTRPKPIERTEQERKSLAAEVKRLRVYDYSTCPYSLKLRNTLHRLNLDIQYCDIRKSQVYRDDLLAQYGRLHAPCLRIDQGQGVQWLDEAEQIIHYLNERFDPAEEQEARAA